MKIKHFLHLFIVVLISLTFSCSSDTDSSQATDFSQEKSLYNLSYGSTNQQVFDLYLPANRNPNTTKTLILIHGGGWTSGDKADMNYVVNIIKQYLPNYAIANINYRLATVGNPAFPMQINDIESIVSKLKNENYGISNQFGFIGVSAGAHLSLLYAYAYNPDVKIVCSIVGPTDFNDINYTSNPFMVDMFQGVTGVNYATNPSYYNQISPVYRATANAQPTIMLYGNADPLIPTTQGQSLHNKLNQLGVYNEFYLYNGGHGDWSIPDQLDAYGKLVTFIQNKF